MVRFGRFTRGLTGGLAACVAALAAAVCVHVRPADAQQAQPAHAIAMYGSPALPADFTHLPYADPSLPRGGRLILALQGTFDSLNPLVVRGVAPDVVPRYVLQSLMVRSADEPFTIYGLLAKSVELPPDRTRVTFRLDPRARFSDGQPVTSADVIFTYELLKEKGKPFHRTSLRSVTGTSAPDALTAIFELGDGSNRELALLIGTMPILARHATNAETFAETTFTAALGSGPYLVAEVKPGESVLLKRRNDFWAEDHPLSRGLYRVDEIRYDFYRDASAVFEAFKAGLYDVRLESDPGRWATGYDVPAVRDGRIIRESLKLQSPKGMTGMVFNTRRPQFSDARVREALGLLFDFEWVNRNLFYGSYRRANSYFADSELSAAGRPVDARETALLVPFPGSASAAVMAGTWQPPGSDGSGRDRELARRAVMLMAQAGFELKDGTMRARADGEPFVFEIAVSSRQQERLALNIASSLTRIGVTARVRLIDDVQYWRRLASFDFDMIQWVWPVSSSPGNEQFNRWSSTAAGSRGSLNFAGVKSPAVDSMLRTMLAAREKDDYVAAVRALDRLLISGHYVIPLYYLPEIWLARSRDIVMPARKPGFSFIHETLAKVPASSTPAN